MVAVVVLLLLRPSGVLAFHRFKVDAGPWF